MRAWMMALIAGAARILKTAGPYTANAVFNVPISTNKIESITGKGKDGTPASSGTVQYREDTKITLYKFSGGKLAISRGPELLSRTFWNGGTLPADYCYPEASGGDIFYPDAISNQQCFYSRVVSESFSRPATTGASTTAFGKVFPGGVGKAAVAVTYTDVAVTPGSSQSLVVPSGGSISTFTYYE